MLSATTTKVRVFHHKTCSCLYFVHSLLFCNTAVNSFNSLGISNFPCIPKLILVWLEIAISLLIQFTLNISRSSKLYSSIQLSVINMTFFIFTSHSRCYFYFIFFPLASFLVPLSFPSQSFSFYLKTSHNVC